MSKRIKPLEIAQDLGISINTVYSMLKGNVIPNIRIGKGRNVLVSRLAYEDWLRSCGKPQVQ